MGILFVNVSVPVLAASVIAVPLFTPGSVSKKYSALRRVCAEIDDEMNKRKIST